MANYPDPRLTRFLLQGFTRGFRVGFNPDRQLKASKRNMRSAAEHPVVISDYIHSELVAGCIVSPVRSPHRE